MHVNQMGKIAQNIVTAYGLTESATKDEIRSAVARFSVGTAWDSRVTARIEMRVQQILDGVY